MLNSYTQHPPAHPALSFGVWLHHVSTAAPELISHLPVRCLHGAVSLSRTMCVCVCVEVIPLSPKIPSLWTNDELNPVQCSSLLPSTGCLCPSETECVTPIKLPGCAGFREECAAEMQCRCFQMKLHFVMSVFKYCHKSHLHNMHQQSESLYFMSCVTGLTHQMSQLRFLFRCSFILYQ